MKSDAPILQNSLLPASYVRWRNSPLGRITDQLEEQLLLELIGDPVGLDVLDVGCGDGMLSSTLAQRGARVVGLDNDPVMLRVAAQRTKEEDSSVRLVYGNANAMPFADASFDRVVAVAILCFIADAEQAIGEMIRVLRPGGMLVMGELGPWSIWSLLRLIRGRRGHPVWSKVHYRSAKELTSLFKARGLDVRPCRGAVFYPPSVSMARLMRPLDPWLGRRTTWGASFIVCAGRKPLYSQL